MNAVFVTQALGLGLHHQLMRALAGPLALDRVGFYVCESMYFRRFVREHPEFASAGHTVLKEWEVMAAARHLTPDLQYLRKREAELDQGPLWDALVCDRRIMQGRWCKERQDYRPRFTHDQMLRILQSALVEIDRVFDAVRPDVTFGFVPVTFGEYLFAMVARARGVPALYLYPTKIRNYMAWMESFFGRPEHIVETYHRYQRDGGRDEWIERAEEYLRQTRGGAVRHEGMIAIPGKIAAPPPRASLGRRAAALVRAELEYWRTESRHDNHVADPLPTQAYRSLVFPLRARLVRARLGRHLAGEAALAGLDYAFYPLHAEPEVALSIHGRPYQNQIETVRNLARSLPAGMALVVKEHPRCIGYRPFGYYEKLLRIPNVVLADPFLESAGVVERARLVTTVWSFVGFEAILKQRPVIALGTPAFGVLPDTMIRQVREPAVLYREIRDLLAGYAFQERPLVHYIAANMRGGVPMDFYSRFLDKRGRYADAAQADADAQFAQFVDYTVGRVRAVTRRSAA